MVDRIPLFPDDDTYPGYTSAEFETVTPDEYRAGPVNYFTQVLGPETASLEEETGVGVTKAPDVDAKETREEDPSPKIPDAILGATRPTLDGGVSEAYEISFDIPDIGGSYSDYLKSANKTDRLSFVENIFEPGFDPDASMELGKGISGAFKEGAERVKAFPDKVKNPDVKARVGVTGLAAATGPIPGAIVGGLLGGTTVKNAFGNNSYRPFGSLGGIADMVHSKQYRDMQTIRAAKIANPYGDTGFAMSLGGFGVTRAPGSGTYTGNTRGMDIETLTSLEAISKGYDPIRGRYNALDPSKSQTVVASGGIQVSNNPMDGFIRANGTVYDPRFIGAGASAAYARTDMIEKAARSFGISSDEMSDAVAVARSGRMTVSQAVQQIQFKNARVVQQRKIDAYNQQKAASAAKQKTSEEQAYTDRISAMQRQYEREQRESDNDDDFSYSQQQTSTQQIDAERSGDPYSGSAGGGGRAMGGRIGLAMGGAPGMASGFVDRPPEQVPEGQTVADNRPAQLPEGAFVINAAAVEFAGSNDIKDMLLKAHKESMRRGLTVDKQGNGAKLIDVAISSGEVVVAPHLAKIIGYDRLNKINNRGKPETRERIQENGQEPVGAAEGGFLTYEGELPDVGEASPMAPDIPAEAMQQFKTFTKKRRQRGDVDRLIDSLDDKSALALAILTETIASKDPLESMEAVGQVIINRANTNDPDFKKVNTVKEVLKQRSGRGSGTKMFQFDGLEPGSVRARLKEVTSGRAPDALNKVYAAAENVLSRQQPDAESYSTLPDHVLYYTKPGAAGAGFFENNPLLEPFSEIGGHSFYAKHRTPEFP